MGKNWIKKRLPKFMIRHVLTLYRGLLYYFHWLESKTYRIIQNPEKEFEVVHKIKGETWEETCYPECYGHSKEMHLTVFSPAEYIFKERNVLVSAASDAIITTKGVFWSKFNNDEFVTWAKPSDYNVLWYDRNIIRIFSHKRRSVVKGKVLSLLGDCSYHWAHCLFEFIPQLFSAGEAGLLDDEITILVVDNVDRNILEIVKNYLKSFPKARIQFAKSGVDYECEELLFMPIPGPCYSDYKFRLDYVEYVPHYVIEQIKRYVIDPLVMKIEDHKPKYEKIFLPRNKSYTHTGRYLTNYDEIHDYFKSIGFVDLEGSTMTLEEKADVFYHAKEVITLFGSSLMNLMFCNQAKCICLSNYKFVTETSEFVMVRDYVSKMITVTGQDDGSEYSSNFYIPLDKIKKVYKEYMMD